MGLELPAGEQSAADVHRRSVSRSGPRPRLSADAVLRPTIATALPKTSGMLRIFMSGNTHSDAARIYAQALSVGVQPSSRRGCDCHVRRGSAGRIVATPSSSTSTT
jgi:hypothetical protein